MDSRNRPRPPSAVSQIVAGALLGALGILVLLLLAGVGIRLAEWAFG